MSRVFLHAIVYAIVSGYGLYKIKLTEVVWPLSMNLLVGALFYGSGFILWIFMLKKYPLSVAFPIATGSLLIATQVIGVYLLKEDFGCYKVTGTVLILIGIVLVSINTVR